MSLVRLSNDVADGRRKEVMEGRRQRKGEVLFSDPQGAMGGFGAGEGWSLSIF